LIARHLEEHGIPTVVMGCARDIVESVGVARFWWSDFPLGHSVGMPHDVVSQRATLAGALSLFDAADEPGTTVASTQVWADDDAWKKDFMDVASLSTVHLEKLKKGHEETRAMKATSR